MLAISPIGATDQCTLSNGEKIGLNQPLEYEVFGALEIFDFGVQETLHAELRSNASKIEDFRRLRV